MAQRPPIDTLRLRNNWYNEDPTGRDVVRGKLGQAHCVAKGTTFTEELGEGRAATKSAPSMSECLVDRQPSLSARIGNLPRPAGRPLSLPFVIGVGPAKNLLDREIRQMSPVADAAV